MVSLVFKPNSLWTDPNFFVKKAHEAAKKEGFSLIDVTPIDGRVGGEKMLVCNTGTNCQFSLSLQQHNIKAWRYTYMLKDCTLEHNHPTQSDPSVVSPSRPNTPFGREPAPPNSVSPPSLKPSLDRSQTLARPSKQDPSQLKRSRTLAPEIPSSPPRLNDSPNIPRSASPANLHRTFSRNIRPSEDYRKNRGVPKRSFTENVTRQTSERSRAPAPSSSMSSSDSPSLNALQGFSEFSRSPEPEMEELEDDFIVVGGLAKSLAQNPLTLPVSISRSPSPVQSVEFNSLMAQISTSPRAISSNQLPSLQSFLSATLSSMSESEISKQVFAFEKAGCKTLEPLLRLESQELKEFLIEDLNSGFGKLEVRMMLSAIGRLKRARMLGRSGFETDSEE